MTKECGKRHMLGCDSKKCRQIFFSDVMMLTRWQNACSLLLDSICNVELFRKLRTLYYFLRKNDYNFPKPYAKKIKTSICQAYIRNYDASEMTSTIFQIASICTWKETNLQVGSSLVLISEDASGLNNVFSPSLSPWDLLRVPNSPNKFNHFSIHSDTQPHTWM